MPQKRVRNGKIRWVGRYRDPAGRERSKTFDTRREAAAWEAEREREMRRGEWVDPGAGAVTVARLVDDAIAEATRPSTRAGREFLAANLGSLADFPASAVQPTHIRQWLAQLRDGRPWAGGTGLAPSTVQMCGAILHGCFTRCVDDDLITRHPMRGVKIPRPSVAVDRAAVLTVEQVEKLASVAESTAIGKAANKQLATMIRVAALTGLRAGEVGGLRVRSVDFLRRELHVVEQIGHLTRESAPLKSDSSRRVVPLPKQAVELLAAHLQANPRGRDDFLFLIAGKPVSSRQLGPLFRKVAKRAGFEATFHDLRHHFASRLIDAGVSVVAVQRVMGHASARITLDVYAHLMPGSDDSIRGALDGLRDQCGTGDDEGDEGGASMQVVDGDG